jgi:hypothetical protein
LKKELRILHQVFCHGEVQLISTKVSPQPEQFVTNSLFRMLLELTTILFVLSGISVSGQTSLEYCNVTINKVTNVTSPNGCYSNCTGSNGTIPLYKWALAASRSSWYTLIPVAANYSFARQTCQAIDSQADLAIPGNSDDLAVMQRLTSGSSIVGSVFYWIGGQQSFTNNVNDFATEPDGGWQWRDGSSIDMSGTYLQWNSMPSLSASLDCVAAYPSISKIRELSCSSNFQFFCEIPCKLPSFDQNWRLIFF